MSQGDNFELADAEHRVNALLDVLFQADLRSLKKKMEMKKCAVSSTQENQTLS